MQAWPRPIRSESNPEQHPAQNGHEPTAHRSLGAPPASREDAAHTAEAQDLLFLVVHRSETRCQDKQLPAPPAIHIACSAEISPPAHIPETPSARSYKRLGWLRW